MLAEISMAEAMGTPPRTIMAKYLLKRAIMEIWRIKLAEARHGQFEPVQLRPPIRVRRNMRKPTTSSATIPGPPTACYGIMNLLTANTTCVNTGSLASHSAKIS